MRFGSYSAGHHSSPRRQQGCWESDESSKPHQLAGHYPHAGIVIGLVLLATMIPACTLTTDQSPPALPEATSAPLAYTASPVGQLETGAAPSVGPQASPQEGKTMILTIVFENNALASPGAGAYDPPLQTGWGFAAWLEYGDQTVLFDTGADGKVLLDNMAALELDPRAIETVVLSHIHGDHTGGLARLLEVNPGVAVYLPQAFPAQFKKQVSDAGATVVEVTDPQEIVPGLWSTGQMGTNLIEQALVIRTEQGLVVVNGCAHPGVDKMVARAAEIGQERIALILGGFHLGKASRGRVEEIIGEFRRLGVQKVGPCHCTGDQARELFRQAYGTDFYACGVGWSWSD